MRKIFKWLLIITLVVLLSGLSLAFLYLQSSRPVYHGEIHIRGIHETTKIFYDPYGVPHIMANNAKDAYFALGYAQAQERLFQMELMRRVGSGRLAEIFGEELVPVDAFFRTLGLHQSARESATMFFSKPGESWQEHTLSFIKGVNAFLFEGPTPPEFLLLDIPKVKFTPEDIYLISGYMSFSFAEALKTDPILDKIKNNFGVNYLNVLVPQQFDSLSTKPRDSVNTDHPEIAHYVNSITGLMPLQPWLGSNGWVLAPKRSASGKVLFANDTHIGYQQPAVWFEAHLEYPSFHLYGKYLAGMPFPLIGHNRDITWGLTMFENDDINLYREKSDGQFPGRYLYKGVWERFISRMETIHIKNRPDTMITIRESVHGPIINDVIKQLDSTETEPVSVWWTYTKMPATAIQVTYQLAHSANINDARIAASMINAPGLNVLYGDKEGNIAMWSAAKLPIYPAGINTHVILDGSSGKDDILGYYSFSDNPSIENPESGFICSANQAPTHIGGMPYPGYYAPDDRYNRITSLISEKEKWTIKDQEQIVNDVISTVQAENARIIHSVLMTDSSLQKNTTYSKALSLLGGWKGRHNTGDLGPTVYYKVLGNILKAAFADELGEEDFNMLVNGHIMKRAYSNILSSEENPWWDNISTPDKTETRSEIFSTAFLAAMQDLMSSSGEIDNWRWGSYHMVEHIHPLGKKKPLDRIFNVGPFPVKGGIETINNAGFPLANPGIFKVSYGPAMRTLLDFKNLDNGLSVLPTGQSGHVRSPHYRNQVTLHLNGKFRPMLMNKTYIQTRCTEILTLRPN
jgi:penicillin G amidase